MSEDYRSRAPWNWQPYLNEMCAEIGVNYDKFIESMAKNRSDMEIAEDFGVRPKSITHLRKHFERYGLGSVIGQD